MSNKAWLGGRVGRTTLNLFTLEWLSGSKFAFHRFPVAEQKRWQKEWRENESGCIVADLKNGVKGNWSIEMDPCSTPREFVCIDAPQQGGQAPATTNMDFIPPSWYSSLYSQPMNWMMQRHRYLFGLAFSNPTSTAADAVANNNMDTTTTTSTTTATPSPATYPTTLPTETPADTQVKSAIPATETVNTATQTPSTTPAVTETVTEANQPVVTTADSPRLLAQRFRSQKRVLPSQTKFVLFRKSGIHPSMEIFSRRFIAAENIN